MSRKYTSNRKLLEQRNQCEKRDGSHNEPQQFGTDKNIIVNIEV